MEIEKKLNNAIREQASKFGIDDYLYILAEKDSESAKKKIEQLPFEQLNSYLNFLTSEFSFKTPDGEIKTRNLMQILETSAHTEMLLKMKTNSYLIITTHAFLSETLPKLHAKVIGTYREQRVKSKLDKISYEEVLRLFSSQEKIKNFLFK